MVPPQVDLKSLALPELEKLLEYHKVTAWKLEKEIMDKKMSGKM